MLPGVRGDEDVVRGRPRVVIAPCPVLLAWVACGECINESAVFDEVAQEPFLASVGVPCVLSVEGIVTSCIQVSKEVHCSVLLQVDLDNELLEVSPSLTCDLAMLWAGGQVGGNEGCAATRGSDVNANPPAIFVYGGFPHHLVTPLVV